MADTSYSTQTRETAEVLDDLRVSPAAHLSQDMARATAGGGNAVALRELAFRPQIGLRAIPGSASGQALENALGLALPRRVGEVTGDGAGLHALWLGPDEFLAVDVSRAQQPGETLVAEAALEGLPGQAVELSANRTILELSGAKAREVLEKSIRADIHPRVFGVGTAIVTQMGPVPIILHHFADHEYRIYPRASFADFAVRWLLDGMAEFVSAEFVSAETAAGAESSG
ncbi:sarcosine oxidase subunit gamma [Brevibacterium sp. GP-SGM9]|uniref:sarcosine oxidase subunit gamma n=1 Tax=Brevibacterium sp. GP-SGM9 TaxID=3376990 RepID=UPI0039A64FE2